MSKIKKVEKERPKMGDLIKGLPNVVTPVQEVRPVATKATAEELVRINGFDVPTDLARRMKIHAAVTGMKQRELLIEALETYLPK